MPVLLLAASAWTLLGSVAVGVGLIGGAYYLGRKDGQAHGAGTVEPATGSPQATPPPAPEA